MFLEAKHLNMGEVKTFRGLQEGWDLHSWDMHSVTCVELLPSI